MDQNIEINELCNLTQNLKVADNDSTSISLKNGCQLFPHQQEVIAWMKHRETLKKNAYGIKGGIVSLCMGLGKTLIALAYSFQNRASFPTLVITSKTVMHEWKTEGVEKFFQTDDVKVLYLHRDFLGKKIEKINRDEIMKYDMVITTYDVCMFSCRKGKYYLQCLEIGEEKTLMHNKIAAIHIRKRRDADLPALKGTDVIYGTPWERIKHREVLNTLRRPKQVHAKSVSHFQIHIINL